MTKRDFTKVSPTIWESKQFLSLEHSAALLYFYYLTGPHQNSSGTYRIPDGYVGVDLGWDIEMVAKARHALIVGELIAYDEEQKLIYLRGWYVQNKPSGNDHKAAIARILENVTSSAIEAVISAEWEAMAPEDKSSEPPPQTSSKRK